MPGKVARWLKGNTTDVLGFSGISLVCWGAWQIYRPLAPILGGAFLVVLAGLIARSKGSQKAPGRDGSP